MHATVARRVMVRGNGGVQQQDEAQRMRERLDRLHAVMEDWVAWCRADVPRVGFPRYSALVQGAPACAADRADSSRAEVVDAAVDDLAPIHRAAILRRYGVMAVWRFPRNNYAEILDAALEALIVILKRKGVDVTT